MRWRRGVTVGWIIGLTATLMVALASPGAAEDGVYPGLPAEEGMAAIGAVGTGMSEITGAHQAVRVPYQTVAAFYTSVPVQVADDDPRQSVSEWRYRAYWVSPPEAANTYGDALPLTVRTVAFGTIPVQVTVSLAQTRTPQDYPVPLRLQHRFGRYKESQAGQIPGCSFPCIDFNGDTTGGGDLLVRITTVRVDGVNLRITGRCQTTRPANLELAGKGFMTGEPGVVVARLWESGRFSSSGGLLTGTVSMPPFTDCTTARGDDLSPLLTSAVSGPDNAVRVNLSGPVCTNLLPPYFLSNGPPPPGTADPEAANCPVGTGKIPPEIPYPTADR